VKLGVKLVAVVIVLGTVYFISDRINYWYRRQWHFHSDQQDLPALERSKLPQSHTAWSNETRDVEAATPQGLKKLTLAYEVNTLGMKLVRIEPGIFLMGLPADVERSLNKNPWYGPMYIQHEVRLPRPFFMGAYEVTNKEYEQFDPRYQRPAYQRGHAGDNHPVQPVPWRKSQEFCRWLSQKEGRIYRLPTEAEWEYACRAGTTNRTYWGENQLDRTKGNFGGTTKKNHEYYADDGYEYTSPVGSFPPNPWGLYDMLGNAWEHVQDWYAPFTSAPAVDPQGPPQGIAGPCRDGSLGCRVHRGGSWRGVLRDIGSAERDGDDPGDLKDIIGFRVACEVE
jgi:formylglycine-generating enzyme required for sulfatase activity